MRRRVASSRLLAFVACASSCIATTIGAPAASALPGQVVATFGPYGNGTQLRAANVALLAQLDHKLVAVGGVGDTIHVSRQSVNGALDPSFGGGDGSVDIVAPNGGNAQDATLQSDGKIVIAGSANGLADFFVVRLRTDGTLDPTFSGDGMVTTDIGGGSIDEAFGVAIGPNGRIVVAGRTQSQAVVVRYLTNGALDTSFSGDGKILNALPGTIAEAHDVFVQADNKPVVSGLYGSPLNIPTMQVRRFNVNGTPDNSFGSSSFATGPLESADVLRPDATGFLVAGSTQSRIGVVHFGGNGHIDATFGSNGIVRASAGAFNRVNDLVVDGSGRIVVIGASGLSTDFPGVRTFVTLFRFTPDGHVDARFGCNGRVFTELLGTSASNTYQAANGAAATLVGKRLFVGAIGVHTGNVDLPPVDLLLVRYKNTGRATGPGYVLGRADGGTSAFGSAPPCGSVAGLSVTAPIVGIADDPAARGSWAVASDGGVFGYGAAPFFGSMGNRPLNAPIVGIAAAPDGNGYWMTASDGGVFSFGSARFFGSMGAVRLHSPVVGIAAAPDGNGYWLVAADGGIFAFGSARFFGSTGALQLHSPVVGMTPTTGGNGYLLAAADGGVFAFGDAHFRGSMGGTTLARPVIGIAADADGDGYWLAGEDGGVFAFAAPFVGSTGASPFPRGNPRVTVAIAATG
jgi:uncharacterized delta-60 repeat protein